MVSYSAKTYAFYTCSTTYKKQGASDRRSLTQQKQGAPDRRSTHLPLFSARASPRTKSKGLYRYVLQIDYFINQDTSCIQLLSIYKKFIQHVKEKDYKALGLLLSSDSGRLAKSYEDTKSRAASNALETKVSCSTSSTVMSWHRSSIFRSGR
jgi:hypothetical protein